MNVYRKFTQQKYPALPNFHTFVNHWEILLYAYLVIATCTEAHYNKHFNGFVLSVSEMKSVLTKGLLQLEVLQHASIFIIMATL